jgi:acyl-CoA thioesterase YciA
VRGAGATPTCRAAEEASSPERRIGDNPGWSLTKEIVPMSANSSAPQVALPTDKELVLKVIPMPADSNANGDIFGGWVMAQVDLAGSVLPARYAKGRMATVAVNQFIFKQPVRVGDILSFYSEVTRIGRTSITVDVEVYAERFRAQGQYVKVTEASVTYVAIDDAGRPRPVPPRE